MKLLKYALFAWASLLFINCSDDDSKQENNSPENETSDLILVKTFSNEHHTLALYTQNGQLTEGYNSIFIQLKDQQNQFLNPSNLSWMPMMQMENMHHSAPHSPIKKVEGKQTLYEGYIVFQMAGNSMEYWNLQLNYTIDGLDYEMNENIDVKPTSKRNVVVFSGTDNVKYIIALKEPTQPKVAVNDMVAGVFKMESMMNFPVVNNYKIKIDPRMPGMGNHGSPNNVDLQQAQDSFYHGKLSLTMSGFWKINLILENQNGEVLKGEEVNESNESSSIFFEIEF